MGGEDPGWSPVLAEGFGIAGRVGWTEGWSVGWTDRVVARVMEVVLGIAEITSWSSSVSLGAGRRG